MRYRTIVVEPAKIMDEPASSHDEASEAVAAYLAASELALASAQQLNAAWRRHFESNDTEPAAEWIAQAEARQAACESALARARNAVAARHLHVAGEGGGNPSVVRIRRRRRRENKLIAGMGSGGQQWLRRMLLVLLILFVLLAAGAGISLALEIAGFLRLIDDPVQLPVGVQLAVFLAASGIALGVRRLMKPVERALYGSKGPRPPPFTL